MGHGVLRSSRVCVCVCLCVHARMQEFRRTRVSGAREVENEREREEKSGLGRLSGCRKRRGGLILACEAAAVPSGTTPNSTVSFITFWSGGPARLLMAQGRVSCTAIGGRQQSLSNRFLVIRGALGNWGAGRARRKERRCPFKGWPRSRESGGG